VGATGGEGGQRWNKADRQLSRAGMDGEAATHQRTERLGYNDGLNGDEIADKQRRREGREKRREAGIGGEEGGGGREEGM
jgi:hypothetical protein